MSHAEGRTCEELDAECDVAEQDNDRLRTALAASEKREQALREALQEIACLINDDGKNDFDGRPCWCQLPSMIPYRGHDFGCELARAALSTVDGPKEK